MAHGLALFCTGQQVPDDVYAAHHRESLVRLRLRQHLQGIGFSEAL
jgi:hypothetical protein